MSFAWPLALLGLVARPARAARLRAGAAAAQRATSSASRTSTCSRTSSTRSPRWRRHVPAALDAARADRARASGSRGPQVAVAVPREEATVILAMDSSGSMTATDVEPDRMTAAREAASSFVEGLPDGFRVGVVSFSNEADVVVPPTDGPRGGARRRSSALVADNGTALGDAIARSVDLGADERSTSSRPTNGEDDAPLVVLLLSDGANTTGDYEPLEAAQKAVDADVPVYTVALGHRRGDGRGPGRLRRHAHDPRSARPGDADTGRRADRRHVLRGRRRGRARRASTTRSARRSASSTSSAS